MSTLSVEIEGLDAFLADVGTSIHGADTLVRAALQNSATHIQADARSRAPHRTGALQRSILTQIDYPSARVSVDEKYGTYMEYGTAPHIIEPKNKQALFWKGALNPYKRIHHPGTAPRPFFIPAINASSSYIQAQFDKVAQRLTDIMAGK